jgi:phage protein D
MAGIDLEKLDETYEGYYIPIVKVYVNEKDIEKDKKLSIKIKDVSVNVTSELKAGIAEYSIVSVTNKEGTFDTEGLKKYISMGTCITIYMGHADIMTEVFKGFIAGVNFLYSTEDEGEYAIRITALDVKGIMMANRSSKRLKANYYSDAVKEILEQPTYQNIKGNNGITDITIYDTPDKQGSTGQESDVDNRIEMVAESDYEFVVKAAKRFNFEFFTIGGNVVFRKAKSNTQEMGEIIPHSSILSFDVGYDITGVVGNVIVRTLDIGKAGKVEVKKKNANTFSIGSKAKPLIKDQTYVYIDSAIESQNEAESRAEYILEDTSYRLGSLKMTLKGIPELMPGRFISLKGFGTAVSNKFYITDVTHEYDGFKYTTTIYGKASTL